MVADEMPPDMPDPVHTFICPGSPHVGDVPPGWSPPDEAGIRHYRGPAPAPATVLDAHTYIGPRIVAGYDRPTATGTMEPAVRVVCVCGWNSDPLPGVFLADAAVLYGDHLQEVAESVAAVLETITPDGSDPDGTVGS